MDIKDKVIILTGASDGIGEATAKVLAKHGAKLVLAARSADKLNNLAKELGAFAVPTNMTKPSEIKNLIDTTVKKFGRLDVLINNAGQGMYGPVETIDIGTYQKIIDLNIYGPLRAMQEVIPVMRKQGEGMILNLSSRVSKNYFPFLAAYASTKYALNALSLTARTELEKDNIVVSVFHPKMTSSKFNEHAVGERPQWQARPGAPAPVIDTPQQVAEQIIEQIKSEEPERSM